MLPASPFSELVIPRKKRQPFLRKLFLNALNRDMQIGLVCPSGKYSKGSDLRVGSIQNKQLLRLRHAADVSDAARLLSQIDPWHRSVFCIVFCLDHFINAIVQDPALIELPVPEVEATVGGGVLGYAFPLDEALLFFGDASVQHVLSLSEGVLDE